jgi:hypothetical protein
VAGERTSKFRLGTGQLLTAAGGKSWISFEDFAVALADEIERPAHIRKRFTVGYQPTRPPPGSAGLFCLCKVLGAARLSAGEILSVTCRGYIRPHRGGAISVRLTGT